MIDFCDNYLKSFTFLDLKSKFVRPASSVRRSSVVRIAIITQDSVRIYFKFPLLAALDHISLF